jgi:hypothetical protein
MPVYYQPVNQLYCVRAKYSPVTPGNPSVRPGQGRRGQGGRRAHARAAAVRALRAGPRARIATLPRQRDACALGRQQAMRYSVRAPHGGAGARLPAPVARINHSPPPALPPPPPPPRTLPLRRPRSVCSQAGIKVLNTANDVSSLGRAGLRLSWLAQPRPRPPFLVHARARARRWCGWRLPRAAPQSPPAWAPAAWAGLSREAALPTTPCAHAISPPAPAPSNRPAPPRPPPPPPQGSPSGRSIGSSGSDSGFSSIVAYPAGGSGPTAASKLTVGPGFLPRCLGARPPGVWGLGVGERVGAFGRGAERSAPLDK